MNLSSNGYAMRLLCLAGVLALLLVSAGAAQPYRANPTTGNLAGVVRSSHNCNMAGNPVMNCSFETGDFTGWVTQDMNSPFFPIGVVGAGVSPGFGLFASSPTEGTSAAINGFDGDGPGTIIFAQDVTLPVAPTLEFDYRGGWDMLGFGGSTQDRVFAVEIEPAGGGAALQTDVILVAGAGTQLLDTGPLSATVDISAFGGQTVRLSFEWFVPENFTGPAFFQLDNVLIMAGVPSMRPVALAVLVVALLVGSLLVFRRRART